MHKKNYKELLQFSKNDVGEARIQLSTVSNGEGFKEQQWTQSKTRIAADDEVSVTELMQQLGISRSRMHEDIKFVELRLVKELEDEHLHSPREKHAYIDEHLFGQRKMEDGKNKLHFTPAGAELLSDFISAPDHYKEQRWARVRGDNQEIVKEKPSKTSVSGDASELTPVPKKKTPRTPTSSPTKVLEKPYDFSALNAAFGMKAPMTGDVNPRTLDSGAVEYTQGKNHGQGKA